MRSSAIVILAVVVLSALPCSAKPDTVPVDAKSFDGHYYKAFKDRCSWQEAKKKCEAMGGYLACLRNAEENSFVADLCKTVGRAWIGGSDENSENFWQWVSGEPFEYRNWSSGNPDNKNGTQHYALIVPSSDRNARARRRWDDRERSYAAVKGFVCEWAPLRADEPLRQRVIALAQEGNLTDELCRAFRKYATARAKVLSDSAGPDEELWQWISSDRVFAKYFAVALYPRNNKGVLRCLRELRKEFGGAVETHPHLAMAFAVYWGREKDWAVLGNRYSKSRLSTMPSMTESFKYYVENEREMVFSLRKTPWELLIFLAENYVPISERLWARRRHGGVSPRSVGETATLDVKYGKIHWLPENNPTKRPKTLQNLLKYGGLRGEQANYANGVCKALGIPSMRGDCSGYAWVVWLIRERGLDLAEFGRYGSSYYGQLPSPATGQQVFVSDVRLMARGISRSYEKYVRSLIACHAYDLVPAEGRDKAVKLLRRAVRANVYCGGAWRRLAEACASADSPPRAGEALCESVMSKLPEFPGLTYDVIETICEGRLRAGVNDRAALAAGRLLERASGYYDQSNRPDLAMKARGIQGRLLTHMGRNEEAVRHYTESVRHHALNRGFRAEPQCLGAFKGLMRGAVTLLPDEPGNNRRLAFVESIATGLIDLKNPRSPGLKMYVIQEHIDVLRKAGRSEDAALWVELLAELRKRTSAKRAARLEKALKVR